MYEYPCRLIRVINGNTIEAEIDLGFNIRIKQKIRLYGVEGNDTISGYDQLVDILPTDFMVKTIYSKRGKVGRVLGVLFVDDDELQRININELLIDKGIAKQFGS